MRVTLRVVGRAHMTVDLPAGSEELLCSMRARLPGDFDDVLSDLGIDRIGEEHFLSHLHTLEVESFKVESDEIPGSSPDSGKPAPEGGIGG